MNLASSKLRCVRSTTAALNGAEDDDDADDADATAGAIAGFHHGPARRDIIRAPIAAIFTVAAMLLIVAELVHNRIRARRSGQLSRAARAAMAGSSSQLGRLTLAAALVSLVALSLYAVTIWSGGTANATAATAAMAVAAAALTATNGNGGCECPPARTAKACPEPYVSWLAAAPAAAGTVPPLTQADAVAILRRFAGKIREVHAAGRRQPCEVVSYGLGWGAHELCRVDPGPACTFYSFGISDDYSFDQSLADLGCRGIGLDPSVTYKSILTPGVMFMQVGARTLSATDDAKWAIVTSVPSLMRWLRHGHLQVLKMDCEGCEYAIAEDVLREDPTFFTKVDQFAFEVHVPKKFLSTDLHATNYARLVDLLERAGMELVYAKMTPCHPDDEKSGCHPILTEAGYPCSSGVMCQNFLFANRRIFGNNIIPKSS